MLILNYPGFSIPRVNDSPADCDKTLLPFGESFRSRFFNTDPSSLLESKAVKTFFVPLNALGYFKPVLEFVFIPLQHPSIVYGIPSKYQLQ